MEIIEACFCVIHISAIAQRVVYTQGSGHRAAGGEKAAPGIIGIGNNFRTAAVQNADHITLDIGDIIVDRAIVIDRHRLPVEAIGEGQGIATYGHLGQRSTIVSINIGGAAAAALCAHPIGIVGKCPGCAALRCSGKLSAVFPGVGNRTIIQRITNGITGYSGAVDLGKYISPAILAVGEALGGQDRT